MKWLLPTLLFLALLSLLPAAPTNPVLDAAAEVSEALAAGNFSEVKVEAAKLVAAATAAHDPTLEKSAGVVAIAPSLAQARIAYKEVGAQTALLAHGVTGYRVIFCPMVPAKWVQKGSAVRNPYYGVGEMLSCGSVE